MPPETVWDKSPLLTYQPQWEGCCQGSHAPCTFDYVSVWDCLPFSFLSPPAAHFLSQGFITVLRSMFYVSYIASSARVWWLTVELLVAIVHVYVCHTSRSYRDMYMKGSWAWHEIGCLKRGFGQCVLPFFLWPIYITISHYLSLFSLFITI